MKIKEINLQHYGPLPKFSKKFNDGVQIVNGSNESGKTLLIDAVMKILIGGKKHDPSLSRVDEIPTGYIIIEKDGEEIKLESEETLEKIMDIDSDELQNIFCIRDADLRITDETRFYERTQDKLANLRYLLRILNGCVQRKQQYKLYTFSHFYHNRKEVFIFHVRFELIELF